VVLESDSGADYHNRGPELMVLEHLGRFFKGWGCQRLAPTPNLQGQGTTVWQFAWNLSGKGGRNCLLPAAGGGFDFTNEDPPPRDPLQRERPACQNITKWTDCFHNKKFAPPLPPPFSSMFKCRCWKKKTVGIY